MPFYTLVAQERKTERWRTCAIFPAGSQAQAITHAKRLRDSHTLGFIPYPTPFKLRRASRRELTLMVNFLNSVDNTNLSTFKGEVPGEYLEGLLYRRRKLLNSFFIGMFLQPEAIKKAYSTNPLNPNTGSSSPSGSGGIESGLAEYVAETAENSSEAVSTEADNDVTSTSPLNTSPDLSASDESPGSEDSPLTDASEQEAALAALLADNKANIEQNGSAELDLDFL